MTWNTERPEPIGIAGAGRLGQALGRMLRLGGQPVSSVASRTPEHAGSAAEFIGPGVAAVSYRDLPRNASRILIAVPDTAIAQIVAVLAAS
ncbi:MAG TPA: NAD(P)-binding domain-containing protein, partial [Bryobacteraceae bacterium]|nr:NAD(P)-binding domain-containing protein [Bryobacteraceae bacterium]